MDSTTQEWMTSRLNGYVMAMAHIDGNSHDSVANAYIADLDEQNLHASLSTHLQQEPEYQHVYGGISEIHAPWSRALVVALDAYFFKRPFAALSDVENRQIKSTRELMVTRIEDLIGMITEDYACKKIYRVEVHNAKGYSGYVHIFPLTHRFLLLKTVTQL